ncbi:MAG: GNAT family N-acetyltransferase [Pedobacter sp.]|uniref:GNAT family N-acetyltransferase n=1 Tax=Pedobacter sp. TaxID=1411316 RepID=UPI002808EAAB|nr:GNAT family N-acetyltransferase [Pedobacter sp.]MDQ8003152.1 GNAT family N-acetyltransferase [Pedobacter sp.]
MEGLRKLQAHDEIPFQLLLLADETVEAIEKYIYKCDVFVLKKDGLLIAVFALLKVDEHEIEIKNIAVDNNLQGQGIGSLLLSNIKAITKETFFKRIIVGTPDISHLQINFYEKNGFVKCGIRKNFFIENYKLPIIENGILLKDMQMLEYLIEQ